VIETLPKIIVLRNRNTFLSLVKTSTHSSSQK